MSRWSGVADGMMVVRPIYDIWIDETWKEFGVLLSTYQTIDQLYCISELVWRNTFDLIPMDAHTTGRKWALQSSGKNLRWETVGLIFSGVGVSAAGLSDWDTVFVLTKGRIKDRPTLVRKLRDAIELIVGLCRECECTNELFASLLVSKSPIDYLPNNDHYTDTTIKYESAVLLEMIRGDTCKCLTIATRFCHFLTL